MKSHKLWLQIAAVLQLLTAFFHTLSFFSEATPKNESERQLFDLMKNYAFNLGGMITTYDKLFTALSACFTLVCAFGGWLNFYLLRQKIEASVLRGVTGIQVVIFGLQFAIMAALTFPPPIVLSGLIFTVLLGAYGFNK
jgi:NO-binding membrane sensor protein with MHYT domain